MKIFKISLLNLLLIFVAVNSNAQGVIYENLPANIDPAEAEELAMQAEEQTESDVDTTPEWIEQLKELTAEPARRLEETLKNEGGEKWKGYKEAMKRLAKIAEKENSKNDVRQLKEMMKEVYFDFFTEMFERADINLPELENEVRGIIPSNCVVLDFLCISCSESPAPVDLTPFPSNYRVQPPSESMDPPPPPPSNNRSSANPKLPRVQRFVKAGGNLEYEKSGKKVIGPTPHKVVRNRGEHGLNAGVGLGEVSEYSIKGSFIKIPRGLNRLEVEVLLDRYSLRSEAASVIGFTWSESLIELYLIKHNGVKIGGTNKIKLYTVAPLIWYASESVYENHHTFKTRIKPANIETTYMAAIKQSGKIGAVVFGHGKERTYQKIKEIRYNLFR